MSLQIKRGEIYYADLNPIRGSEQGGLRPVLIVQNDIGNLHSPTVVAAPITGKPKKEFMPTHYLLPAGCGLEIPSLVLLEQIRTIDKCRLGQYIGMADKAAMKEIDRAIAVSVGLEPNKTDDSMLMALCSECVTYFHYTEEHIVRRANPNQQYKDGCDWCNGRKYGWDYEITRRAGK